MRGRDRFKVVKPFLRFGTLILKIIPRPLCNFGLALVRHVPTVLGVGLRYMFVARLAKSCGDNVLVAEGVHLFSLAKLSLGDNVSIHPMCYVDAGGGITIGNNVSIAHATTIMSTEHDFSNPEIPIRDAPCMNLPVVIEDDVWLGAGVRVLAGVRIGNNSVVGGGTVLTKSVPPHSLVVGVPGKVIRSIRQNESGQGDPVRAAGANP